GDEPIDLLRDCLERVIHCYEQDVGRKPSSPEVLECLTQVFNLFGRVAFPDLAEKEVTAVVLKAKKLGKTQKYGVGDVFAIPLRDGYRYGRIIKPTAAGQLVEIYDLHSDRLLA